MTTLDKFIESNASLEEFKNRVKTNSVSNRSPEKVRSRTPTQTTKK